MLGPNITGSITKFDSDVTSSGAFYNGPNYKDWNPIGDTDSKATYIYLDASRSSSVYITDGHVYPSALKLNYIIKC